MLEPKTERARKRNLLRRVRRQRLKYITILPSLITLLNGVCGFAAIGFASKGFLAGVDNFSFHKLELPYFAMSGYMIFFAMIADMLDGRVARMSQTTSSFGGQLDSLCDIISFGVAPAFLMFKILDYKLAALVEPTPALAGFLGRFIWLTAAIYIACAAIRLARFNVENEEDETAHMAFVGLPVPAAGGVLASIIVFYEDMLPTMGSESVIFSIGESVILYSLPFIAMGVALLMISRIPYPHLINQYFKGRKPVTHLFWSVAIIGLIYLCGLQSALLITFCGFAVSGVVRWFYYKIVVKDPRQTYLGLSVKLSDPSDSPED
ncbi:MAG: CDP-alcohol phosphatidyltransferase family protein [Planctomycetota bacterium]|jgi:CDP-diacylglycerol--serine O-phosphatidyltransferase